MRFTCFLLFSVFAFNLQSQDATDPVRQEGIETIIRLFKEKPLVAIGEIHGHSQLYDFLGQLIKEEGFYTQVNDILIEAGNALYQDILDRYISGEDVDAEELRLVWMNTTQSPVDPWGSKVYLDFLLSVRELNQAIAESHRIRVIAADPPIDWETVKTREDYNEARGSRNEYYAQTAITQVLNKGRRALMISGGAHFGYHNPKSNLVNQKIEKEYPGSVVVLGALADLGRGNETLTERITDWPLGTIALVKDTWIGQAPGPRRMVMASTATGSSGTVPAQPQGGNGGPPPKLKQDYFDYLLFFGKEQIGYGAFDPSYYELDSIWKEMNRRSVIRFGNHLLKETRNTGILRPTAYN